MIGVHVSFTYDGDFDRDRVTDVAAKARTTFEEMAGLRFKIFALNEKEKRVINFYVWNSREVADAFFTNELRERVTGLYGEKPLIEFVEIIEMVDNSGL